MHVEWELPLDEITERSHRDDLGDLTELVVSIAQVGMVRPIALRADHSVISGARRLQAARELGLERVPVLVVDELSQAAAVLAEDLAEHEGQLPMGSKAQAALGLSLEELPRRSGIETRGQVAKALGMSAHGWQRLRTVAEAVEAGELEPEVFEEIDENGTPTPVWHRLQSERTGKAVPDGKVKQWTLDTDRKRRVAEKARDRFALAAGAVDGYRQGLADMLEKGDLVKVLAVADDKELEDWRRVLAKTTNTLRHVRDELQKGEN